jgi:Flp pilus assembly protein TadG
MKSFNDAVRRFVADEDAAATVLALTMLLTVLLVGSYAVDVGNVMRARTQLQVAVDVAAHAALVQRELLPETSARAEAAKFVQLNMPLEDYGYVIQPSDIVFGSFDDKTFKFTPVAGSRQSVQVTARRITTRENALNSILLRLVGVDKLNLVVSSTFATFKPTCLYEGYVAEMPVDLQSNNAFGNGFCIHSNTHVEMNQGNSFEAGTVVSMPDLDDLVIPASGMTKNLGLNSALHEGSWNIRIIERIDEILGKPGEAGWLETFDPLTYAKLTYITDLATLVTLPAPKANTVLTMADFTPGRVHIVTCGKHGLTLGKQSAAQPVIRNIVLIAKACDITFENGVIIEDAVIGTTSTGDKSMYSSNGFQLGKNDNCADGGDAQLVTMGTVRFASGMSVFNGQILAKRDVYFQANANNVKGVAIVAGGEINTTSNGSAAFCGTGMGRNFTAEYFRLAL